MDLAVASVTKAASVAQILRGSNATLGVLAQPTHPAGNGQRSPKMNKMSNRAKLLAVISEITDASLAHCEGAHGTREIECYHCDDRETIVAALAAHDVALAASIAAAIVSR